MKNLILNRIAIFLIPIGMLVINGCSSSQPISENDDKENESLFVQREFGAEVFIIMKNGAELTGELLSVRDSSILLCKEYEADEEDLADLVYPVYSIENHDIKLIELKGENKIILGLVLGAGLGAGTGAGISSSGVSKKRYRKLGAAASGCCVGGLIGALIGVIIGGISSTDDEVVYEYANPGEYDFTQLNIYSRYGGKEPDYLKEIK
ncbi:hypothetical protein ACFLSS_02520 [Bacteroidota bacterium]